MFKQEIINEYASRIYGDMRRMNVPYRIIQHYFCGLYVYICLKNRMGAFRFEETGIGGKFTTVSHISIVSPVNCCFQMIVFSIGFH